jgi:hypothetical protein
VSSVAGSTNPPEPPTSAEALVGLLAEPARLQVVAALALGADAEDQLVKATGLDPRTVEAALERLVRGGLVRRERDGRVSLDAERFGEAARRSARRRKGPPPEELGATPEQARVLRHFLEGGRLRSIPTAKGKRRVVLDFLAGQFEPGRRYPEREVNRILARFHPDVAALRRYLVDEEFLERREGSYWRAGGTFDVG